ncbi:MAG: TetR/AcrR family transcriptional regulator [Bacteroidetes bacterium]|nr:MAG: TetR/AcrR family transcriptional regulator [Bacteroidota bacterium]
MTKEEKIRNEVITAAQGLFQQFGFDKTTMEDIAKSMGKGKSTLYYYYSSKEEILDEVKYKEVNDIFTKVKDSIDKVNSAEGKMRAYVLTMFKEVKKKINLYKIVAGEIQENYRIIHELRKNIDSIEVNILRDILVFGAKNKEFNINEKDAEGMAYLIVSSFRGMEIDLLIEKKIPKWESRVEIMLDILFKGLIK